MTKYKVYIDLMVRRCAAVVVEADTPEQAEDLAWQKRHDLEYAENSDEHHVRQGETHRDDLECKQCKRPFGHMHSLECTNHPGGGARFVEEGEC